MTNTHDILLGFDFGMKRIGVAVGQTVTKTARPLTTLKAEKGMPNQEALTKLVKIWQPTAIVVGIPLNMDGTEQAITQDARRFVELLRNLFKIPIHEMDERLTTKAAREALFEDGGYKALQNGQVDSVAAQLILQNWINSH